jgi:hypothetical protein
MMTEPDDGPRSPGNRTTSGSMEVTAFPALRLAVLRFAADTSLTGEHGAVLVAALETVVGDGGQPFGLLADTARIGGTDAEYRATTGVFFKDHRDRARIALYHLGPLIRVVAEMFRIAVGLQMRSFKDEAAARAWLRTQGIDA